MNYLYSSRILIYVLSSTIILGFFWEYYYIFDLFSHFYLQLCIIIFLLCIWYIYRRYYLEIFIAILCCSYLGFHLMVADFSGFYDHTSELYPDIMFMNTEYLNTDIAPIIGYINTIKPKSIAMVELNAELFTHIKEEGNYKYSYYYPDFVYSFWFFTNDVVIEQHTYIYGDYPIWYFRTADRIYFVVHPLPPMSDKHYHLQKEFFKYLTHLIEWVDDFVLLWDLNSTPYSRVFQSFFGKYFYKTTYSWWVDTILSIPIDHIISDTYIRISAGTKLSSDHIAIFGRF